MKNALFTPISAPPLWVSVEQRLPTKADADRHNRVWAVAIDANGRPYPCESYYKHIDAESGVYTHWAVPPVKTWLHPEEAARAQKT